MTDRAPRGSLAMSVALSSRSSSDSNESSSSSITTPTFVLRGHTGAVHSLCLIPEHHLLMSGDADANLKLWNLSNRRAISQISGLAESPQTSAVLAIQRLQQGQGLKALCQLKGGNVHIVDFVENKSCYAMECQKQAVETGSFSFARLAVFGQSSSPLGSGEFFVIPGDDPSDVKVWSASQSTKDSVLSFSVNHNFGKTQMGSCNAVKTFHDEIAGRDLILTGTEDGSIAVWDTAFTRKPRSLLKLHNHPLLEFELIQDTLARSDDDGNRKIVGVAGASGKTISSFEFDVAADSLSKRKRAILQYGGVGQLSSCKDSSIVAAACWSHAVELYNWQTMQRLSWIDYHTESVHAVSIAVLQDSSLETLAITSGGADKRIAVTLCPKKPSRHTSVLKDK
eukprot:TRINITY_DN23890_c0_g1_i1.p1 TRINITY_DN23890_c0_g1~~TRINITY_DN23890_c0_g1_i1.p1  ORF type:complete len:396 (-),score=95.56 TRINITY_DN23890_c0_g1_i1:201-1388(-)